MCVLLFQCPALYTPYNGHCYYVSTVEKTWSKAQTDCRLETNGDLAIIEDQAENDFIRDMIQADISMKIINTMEPKTTRPPFIVKMDLIRYIKTICLITPPCY